MNYFINFLAIWVIIILKLLLCIFKGLMPRINNIFINSSNITYALENWVISK